MPISVDLFVAYSHKDVRLRDQLAAHLAGLRDVISTCNDRCIGPGDGWKGMIDEHLDAAGAILLLISADFLASGYCYDAEMTRALERSRAGQALLIPIILRACEWNSAPFARLRALPANGVPVTSWSNTDEAWCDIAREIRRAIASPTLDHTKDQHAASDRASNAPRLSEPRRDTAGATAAVITQPRSAPPFVENRICTIVFVDFSAATRNLSPHVELEEASEIVSRCYETVTRHITRLDGVIARRLGDCMIAVFGAPRARSNDAERAVLALLNARAAVHNVTTEDRSLQQCLTIRAGIHTGRVNIISYVDTEPPSNIEITGQTLNIASKLQQGASDDDIIISSETLRQVAGSFNTTPVGVDFNAHRVLARVAYRPITPSPTSFQVDSTRFVGRSIEEQQLAELLDRVVREKRAKILTITGPAGIGRSRLLFEFLSRLTTSPDRVVLPLSAQCLSLGEEATLGLAASLIRMRFDIKDGDQLPAIKHKVRRGIRWFSLKTHRLAGAGSTPSRRSSLTGGKHETDEIVDTLVTLVSARTHASNEARSSSLLPDDAGERVRSRLGAVLARLLTFAAARTPLVIACDEIHWADHASLDLLDELIFRVKDAPIFVVCTARPDLHDRRPFWGGRRATSERIELRPLAPSHVHQMVRDHLRYADDLPQALVERIADRAEGNALVVVETLRWMVETGVICTESDPWVIRQDRLSTLDLPTTIQSIVQARLDRLREDARHVLQRAAVVGRTFWWTSLERLRCHDDAGAPARPLDEIIELLHASQVIEVHESSLLAGEREFAFVDSATHEVSYATLSLKLRRLLHQLVAGWIEERHRREVDVETLAKHYAKSGVASVPAALAQMAAARALVSVGQNTIALGYFERARDIYDSLHVEGSPAPSGAERHTVSWVDRVSVYLDLGDVYRRLGRLEDAESAYNQARARILRDEGRSLDVCDLRMEFRCDACVDYRLALIFKLRGNYEDARLLVERAIKGAISGDALRETPPMYSLLAFLHRRLKRPAEALRAARTGLRACPRSLEKDPMVCYAQAEALIGVANALHANGRLVSARRTYLQALRLVPGSENPHLAGIIYNGLAAVCVDLGDRSTGLRYFRESLALRERAGDLHQIAVSCNNVAQVELSLGHVQVALEHALRAVELGERTGAKSDLGAFHCNLAEAFAAANNFPAALAHARWALEASEARGEIYLAEVVRAVSEMCANARAAADSASLEPMLKTMEGLLGRLSEKHLR